MSDTKGTGTTRQAGNDETPVEAKSQSGPWAMVPAWVLTMDLTGNEVAIYVALRTFCDREGICWPTARTISERAGGGRSVSAVRNAIQKFRRLGLLETEAVYRKGSRELAHLRYHLIDVDPRRWEVTRRDVSLNPGIPQPSDTPHSPEVEVSLSPVTQEHTNDHTTEQDSSDARKLASSSSTHDDDDVRKSEIKRPRTRQTQTAEQRTAARKQRERNTAIADICNRLGADRAKAAALCDHLVEEYGAGNIQRYVEGIDDFALETHLEAAADQLEERRDECRERAARFTSQLADYHPHAAKADLAEIDAAIFRAIDGGMDADEVSRRINAAAQAKSTRKIAARYVAALMDVGARAA